MGNSLGLGKRSLSALLLIVVCSGTTPTIAAPFTNGSFETPNTGSFSIASPSPWTTTVGALLSDAVGYLGPAAADGLQYMELNVPAGKGTIAQTFDVTAGHDYKFTFALAGVADGAADTLCVDVTASPSSTTNYCIDTGTTTNFRLSPWTVEEYFFTASPGQTSSTLTVASTTLSSSGLYYGPAVDDFVLTDLGPTGAPEPATLVLLGLGLVGVGFAKRRKQKQAA